MMRARSAPAGLTLLETMIAVALMASVLIALAQLMAAIARQQQQAQARQTAALEAANVLEQIVVMPFDQLAEQSLASLQLSQEAQQILRQPQLKVAVVEESVSTDLAAKRVRVELSWADLGGQRVEPVVLTTWIYPPEEQTP